MSKEVLRGFDKSLPMSLLKARESVMKNFLPSLKEQDLSSQQWRVIRALHDEDGIDMSALADRCYLLMPSLSRIVSYLEGRNLIRRKNVAEDQRKSAIYLTQDGAKIFSIIGPKSAERYDYIAEKFGPGKLNLLYELLDELVEKLDE